MAVDRPRRAARGAATARQGRDARTSRPVSLSRFPTLPQRQPSCSTPWSSALRPERPGRLQLRHPRRPALRRAARAEDARARSADRGGARGGGGARPLRPAWRPARRAGSRRPSTTSRRCARLRLAACLLADIAWAAHPDFRAERGIDMALHGNWVAIDAPGRVMLAQALFSNFGGGRELPYPDVAALCTPEELERASRWGYAMRLGQRLSGGVAAGLERSRVSRRDGDACASSSDQRGCGPARRDGRAAAARRPGGRARRCGLKSTLPRIQADANGRGQPQVKRSTRSCASRWMFSRCGAVVHRHHVAGADPAQRSRAGSAAAPRRRAPPSPAGRPGPAPRRRCKPAGGRLAGRRGGSRSASSRRRRAAAAPRRSVLFMRSSPARCGS